MILFLLAVQFCKAQQFQGFAFNRITTSDGKGLASNLVQCLYQDTRGYIWVGTANGLQRFDGGKFVYFATAAKNGSEPLPYAPVGQIIGLDSTRLLISFYTLREFGIFNTADFSYHKLQLKTKKVVQPRSDFFLWKSQMGEVFLHVSRLGLLRLDLLKMSFVDDQTISFPKGWIPTSIGAYEDVINKRIWLPCDSGLCVYDRASKQVWSRHFNPNKLAILNNERIQDGITTVYIDQKRRFWIVGWPKWGGGGQQVYCLDSTGAAYLNADTTGIRTGPVGYTEFHHFYETRNHGFWVYGAGILFNYDRNLQKFDYIASGTEQIGISYETIYQVMEDRDGSLWFATDRGLFFTPVGTESYALVNLIFGNKKEPVSVTDILELPNEDIWIASWGTGIKIIDKFFRPKTCDVYRQPPPASWDPASKWATKLTWSLCRERLTGHIWIGCNSGVLLIYDPEKKTTRFLQPAEAGGSTIRYIAEDRAGRIWLGTQSGKLICYENGQFRIVQEIGTIIYKIFVDKQGWIWLATHEKGLYAVHPVSGKVIQHYTANMTSNRLYSNTGSDIEQLNDSIIVYGAGVLNFVNKWTGRVSWLSYEDGLPSNNVYRLRMDKKGYLWIITSSGLCRFNPMNNHITPYGRKDGILVSEQTSVADLVCNNGNLIFGGSNNVLLFDPGIFSNNKPPSNVSITDFKIFNEFLPVDSLLAKPVLKLNHNQNSVSIYFSSLSFTERDKLTYYYKMEGIDKNWIKADQGYFANYSLLPPGKYTFSVYCENLEGVRSSGITSFDIQIKPPFWRTGWFISSLIFLVLLVIYDLHNARVKRLLAVEKLRNKVARDLHDDMGSTLSTINILASMAKTKMNTDAVKTSEYLGKISENSQRMMEAMDDIVWSIKPSNDSMQRITSRMREFATHVLEAKGMDLEFHVAEDVQDAKLNMEMRRDFFLVFKEALNNAAKYSKASRVSVNVSITGKRIILSVKDDGVGFDMQKNSGAAFGGNGMGNMKKRAESMNGTLTILSTPGAGTEVILRVPER
jgi:signal transduction histidine kinase/ligand-binding sensor domain-containing protein